MKQRQFCKVALAVMLLESGVSGRLFAQSPNATLAGTITDSSGGGIPGASVVIKNTATGTAATVMTGETGSFRVADLIPGTYEMDVTKDGFKTTVKQGIELHVQSQVTLDQALEVGSVSESVTVQSGAPTLDAESPTVGQVIEGRQVEEMPLNGHNVMNLMALATGVVPQGTTSGTAVANQASGFTNPAGWNNYQIGGAVAGWNSLYLDGEPINVSNQNWLSLVPTQESVGEFRVDTSAVSPQYGRFAGGVVSYSTKSGGNDFHGTAYDYFRNTVLNAQTFFGNRTHLPKAVLIQNQYGAAVGGPIVRSHAFFFFSWEGLRRISKTPVTALVPSVANRNGDFSATASTKPIYDPLTGAQFTCNGQLNVICSNRIDATAAAMNAINYFALPNTMGAGYNYATSSVNRAGADQYVGRIDEQISEKQRLFGRYTNWQINQQLYPTTSTVLYGSRVNSRTNQAVLGDSYTYTPSLVGDVRAYYNRFIYTVTPTGAGNPNLSQLGGNFAHIGDSEPYRVYPGLTLLGYAGLSQLRQQINHDIYGVSASFTKSLGRHSISFGGEARRVEWYNLNNQYAGGQFYFSGTATSRAGAAGTGDPVADFILGSITPAASQLSNAGTNPVSLIETSEPISGITYYQGYYITDSFKLGPKLNVTAGLRYELPGTWTEKKNRDTVLQPNAASPLGTIRNPVTGQSQALTGILAPVGSPLSSSRQEFPAHYSLFDPRVGLNYAPNRNMVLRAGFGISQPTLDAGSQGPSVSPVNQAITTPTGSLSNPFPSGILPPLGHNLNINLPYTQFADTLAGSAIDSRLPNQAYPTVYQYNLNLQRTIGASGTAEIAYVGSHGSHMPRLDTNLNQLPDQYLSMGAALLARPAINPLVGLLPPSSSIVSAAGSNNVAGQFLRPFPQFLAVASSSPWSGNVTYNALQAKAQRHFHGGSSVLFSYTWAKTISDFETQNAYLEAQTVGTPQDFYNPRADRSNAQFDVRHRFVASYILDLPFGKGKRFLNGGGVVDRAVGGWTVSGITTLQTGFPLALAYGPGTVAQQIFGAGQARPNVVQGCAKNISGSAYNNLSKWFNTSCFTAPSNYGFGNEARVDANLRAQGPANWDITARKLTTITDRVGLEFRAEYFNVFNRVQFAAPATSLGASTFGIVTAQANNPRQLQLDLSMKF